jgi:hypothetical protein
MWRLFDKENPRLKIMDRIISKNRDTSGDGVTLIGTGTQGRTTGLGELLLEAGALIKGYDNSKDPELPKGHFSKQGSKKMPKMGHLSNEGLTYPIFSKFYNPIFC